MAVISLFSFHFQCNFCHWHQLSVCYEYVQIIFVVAALKRAILKGRTLYFITSQRYKEAQNKSVSNEQPCQHHGHIVTHSNEISRKCQRNSFSDFLMLTWQSWNSKLYNDISCVICMWPWQNILISIISSIMIYHLSYVCGPGKIYFKSVWDVSGFNQHFR